MPVPVKTSGGGRSRGDLSTKIHTVVDALRNPRLFSAGQASNLDGVDILLPQMEVIPDW